MGISQTFAISAAAMEMERLRVDVAAANLAGARVPLAADGSGYRPMRVVARAAASVAFSRWWQPPLATLVPSADPPRQDLDPGHPLADAQGFVRYPGVDLTVEMTSLLEATRSYEANLAVLQASRAMFVRALDIGGTP